MTRPPRGIDCQGKHNFIHGTVTIQQRDPSNPGTCEMGDCNTIHENVKILVGPEGFKMGDYNVLHNGMFITGNVQIGHNCWFGQGTHLDGTGGLTIGNGVTTGYHSHIWSHAERGSRLSGCLLYGKDHTILEDECWLVGNNINISPGVTLARRSIVWSHAVVTKSVHTEEECTYAGIPARKLKKKYWKPLDSIIKFRMLYMWLSEFAQQHPESKLQELHKTLRLDCGKHALIFGEEMPYYALGEPNTFFNIDTMTYTKKLTVPERQIMMMLCKGKANFVPLENKC